MLRRSLKFHLNFGQNFDTMATVVDALTAFLTVYRGSDERSRRARFTDAESSEIKFTLSQGYDVAHAILVAHLRSRLPTNVHTQLAQLVFKLEPSNDAGKGRFIVMNADNFDSEVRRIHKNAITRQRIHPGDVRIPFVVYISEPAEAQPPRNGTTAASLRRATVARIQTATEEISTRLRDDPPVLAENERLGDVSMNVWARQRARNPNPDPVPVMPQSLSVQTGYEN